MIDPPPAVDAPRAEGAAPQGGSPGGQAVPSRALSAASLILGAAGLLFGWGLLGVPSIVAVVLGHLALRREPEARTTAVVGLVLGYLGIAAGLLIGVLIAIAITLPFAFLATFPTFTAL